MEHKALKALFLFLESAKVGKNNMCPNFYLDKEDQYEHGVGPETECCQKICHESLGSKYFYKQKNNWNRCPCRVLGQEKLINRTAKFFETYSSIKQVKGERDE